MYNAREHITSTVDRQVARINDRGLCRLSLDSTATLIASRVNHFHRGLLTTYELGEMDRSIFMLYTNELLVLGKDF